MQATYLSTWPCDEIFLPAGASKCGWSSCREGKGMFWPHSWYLTWWVPRLYHGPVWVQPRVCGVQASQWGQGDHIYQHVLSPPSSNLIFQPGCRPLRQHQGMWLPTNHCLSKLVRINVLLILHWNILLLWHCITNPIPYLLFSNPNSHAQCWGRSIFIFTFSPPMFAKWRSLFA